MLPSAETINLSEAVGLISDASRLLTYESVAPATLSLEPDTLHLGDRTLQLGPAAEAALWRLVDLPISWAQSREAAGDRQTPAMVWEIVTRQLSGRGELPEQVKVYSIGDVAIDVVDPRLQILPCDAVLDAVVQSFPASLTVNDVVAHRVTAEPGHFELNLVTSSHQIEPRPGDIIDAGISVLHSVTGCCPTQVTPYLRRLVCENGLIVVVHPQRGGPRIRRVTARSGRVTDMLARLRCALTDAWQHVAPALEQVSALAKTPLAGSGVAGMLNGLRATYALRKVDLDGIEAAMSQDPGDGVGSVYDIVNAITRFASHTPGLSLLRRRELLRAAGDIAVRYGPPCPLCGTPRKRQIGLGGPVATGVGPADQPLDSHHPGNEGAALLPQMTAGHGVDGTERLSAEESSPVVNQ